MSGDGSTLIAGTFDGRLPLGEATLISAGARDAFVARLGRDGRPQWARSFGGAAADSASAIAVDADGTAYVAGEFSGTALLGGEPLSATGAADVFVAAIDPAGAITWLRQLQATGYVSATAIAVSAKGDVAIAGYFGGALEVGNRVLHSAGELDAFVVALDRSGNPMWVRRAGGEGGDLFRAVAFGPSGEVALAGAFSGDADVLGLPLSAPGRDTNAFAALLSNAGEPVWARGFGAAGPDVASSIAVGPDGSLYIAGWFADRIELGPHASLEAGAGGSPDGFVARLSLAGDGVWATRLGAAGADRARSVAAGDEIVVVGGEYEHRFALESIELRSRGRQDVFVAKLSERGAPMWVRNIGGRGSDSVAAIAVGADARIAVTGTSSDDLFVDGKAIATGGRPASFLAQLSP